MMRDELFDELMSSVKEMEVIRKGKKKASRTFKFADPKVKAIREQTGLSQNQFAQMIGVSKRTLENWEQGRRSPTGPAKALLKIVSTDPKGTIQALHG